MKKIKSNQQKRICPLYRQTYYEPPCTSRVDGKTKICPDCGMRESLQSIGVCNEEQEKIINTIHQHTQNR
nr:MAG TPA: hypothetical protein [Caudoviricetes sp.]